MNAFIVALPVSVRLVHSDTNVVMGACELIGRNVEGGAASRTYVVTMPSSCLDCCPVERHRYSMGVGKTHLHGPPTDAGANEHH
jgi:hypothetical protein